MNIEENLKFNKQCIQHSLFPIYTNIKLHDAKTGAYKFVNNFRRELILAQIEQQEKKQKDLLKQLHESWTQLKSKTKSPLKMEAYQHLLKRTTDKNRTTLQLKHEKKLCRLYESPVPYKQQVTKVYNLSDVAIGDDIHEILQLGINCHLKTPVSTLQTKVEIEKLYQSIQKKEKEQEITVNNHEQLRCELKRFGLQQTRDYNSDLLTRSQYKALKEFRENNDIVIRKADKTNGVVVLNKDDYIEKIQSQLSDTSKFRKLRKDPT